MKITAIPEKQPTGLFFRNIYNLIPRERKFFIQFAVKIFCKFF